jgi:shikimate 5-dehydrogenase
MAYRAVGHPALYVPFAARSLSEFWTVVLAQRAFEQLGLTLGGLTVASPFKEEAATLPISHSALATRAKSSNLIVRSSLGFRAESTDPESFRVPLAKRRLLPAGQRVAVIGCGGSGRAIAAALDLAGAHVKLVNRSVDEGRRVASFLGLPFVALSEFVPRGFSMIINATPVGREEDALPFRVGDLDRGAIVLDLVYSDQPTPLVREAIAAGHVVVDGNEVLAAQVRRQFESMTGFCMDVSE